MRVRWRFDLFICCWILAALVAGARADDAAPREWSQFRGPDRNGVSAEKGLLEVWSAKGPEVIWRAAAGEGSSGISVSRGRAYTMVAGKEEEFAVSLDTDTGKELWRVAVDLKFINPESNGPRATPTVDGDRLYTVSGLAKIHALGTEDGSELWHRDLKAELGGETPEYGFAVSPLVEGDLLYINGGGREGNALIAFNKHNGELVWTSHTDKPGYASPILVDFAGTRQLLFMTQTQLIAVSPHAGEIYWSFPWTSPAYHNNIATPILIPDAQIFISTGYGVGSALLELRASDGGFGAAPVWRKRIMRTHFHSAVYHDGYLYGFDNFLLKCIEVKTGQPQWAARGYGEGSLIAADEHLIIFGQRGKLALVEATPEAYREKSSAQMLTGRCYASPTLADGRLYIRNEEEILCLKVTP